MNINFSKNSHDTFFVDLFNLNNFDTSEIFWEINISGVIGRVHFSSQNFSKSKKFSLQFFFCWKCSETYPKQIWGHVNFGRRGSAYRIISQTQSSSLEIKVIRCGIFDTWWVVLIELCRNNDETALLGIGNLFLPKIIIFFCII